MHGYGYMSKESTPKENGLRSHGGRDSFEWWYTDAEFDDGTTVVTIFFTKNYFDVTGIAWPTVDLEITLKNGKKIHKFFQEPKPFIHFLSFNVNFVQVGIEPSRKKEFSINHPK